MRKTLILVAVIAAMLPPALFADNAEVMPKRVLRTYYIGSYSFGDQAYDSEGDKVDTNEAKAATFSFAAEYGVSDWISAAVQWTPAWTFWSEIEEGGTVPAKANANGLYDIFMGAKFQIVGPLAPIPSEKYRFCAAGGFKVPAPDKDWTEEYQSILDGEDATVSATDRHALGIGMRLYFDYVLAENLYFNLYSEYIRYLERKDVLTSPTPEASEAAAEADIDYGHSLVLEFEPHYKVPLAGESSLELKLQLTYTSWPETEKDGVGVDGSEGYSLKLTPSSSYFFFLGPLPFEASLGCGLSLAGKNDSAMTTLTAQLISYIKL
ncbi:MAG TPA: hypothetical protein P5142_08260 [Spirochaetia bacterium]|nr:hypothetical protein [Spirochaetia bacterium]